MTPDALLHTTSPVLGSVQQLPAAPYRKGLGGPQQECRFGQLCRQDDKVHAVSPCFKPALFALFAQYDHLICAPRARSPRNSNTAAVLSRSLVNVGPHRDDDSP